MPACNRLQVIFADRPQIIRNFSALINVSALVINFVNGNPITAFFFENSISLPNNLTCTIAKIMGLLVAPLPYSICPIRCE